MEKTLGINEWGGFEHIVIFSKIYCIILEIHSFGSEIHISDGDDFFTNKECISLLYCNRRSWGEQPNHYDLLHSVKQTHKPGKQYVTKDRDNIDPVQRLWEGDFEASATSFDQNKEPKRLYKEELEDGTRITSINLSGSQFDF
eukprot:14985344-Heterocapsa_arctica.AAC.1